MIKHHAEIIIERPADTVFAYMTEAQNMSTWQPKLIKAENLSGQPWQVGTQLKETRQIGGNKMVVTSEIASFAPERGFTVKSVSGPMTKGEFQLEKLDNMTCVHFSIEMSLNGLMRLVEPFISKDLKQQVETSLAQLKAVLERNIGD